jgi:S-adenosylmethionine hydrolase
VVIVLFSDFGAADLYVGQVKAVLASRAPRVRVLDALHDAPAFAIEPAAHLLAALAPEYPPGSVFLAVIDPGVGGARKAIVVKADGRSFVGPDNGLLSVLWRRARSRSCFSIRWRPPRLSSSFHGRDLFAPVAAALATRSVPRGWLAAKREPAVLGDAGDLARVIYVDHYGNCMTGVRARNLPRGAAVYVRGRKLERAETFSLARPRRPFWYANSLGLVEIAANGRSAARALGLRPGHRIRIAR